MAHDLSTNVRLTAVAMFTVFAAFLIWASAVIPNGAGPDEWNSIKTIQFYQTYKRLALFPDDADKVRFSSYGSTRLTRPPFPFFASAISAELNPPTAQAYGVYRYPSALMIALSIVVIFLALVRFGIYAPIAFTATILVTSLPQYLFHGAYVSDDAGAFLATALQLASALMLVRFGITRKWIIMTAAIIGFTICNKITGWLALPALFILFLLELWRNKDRSALARWSTWGLAILAFVVAGGYWVIYNIIQYGDDPFLMKLNRQLFEQYATLKTAQNQGYAARFQMGAVDVLFNADFMSATYRAFIGNLDLLRLPAGPVCYIWFGLILIASISGFFKSLRAQPTLCAYAVIWVALQFYMYLHFNVRNDIQIQGKYLLPIVPLIALFFAQRLKSILRFSKPNRNFLLLALIFISFTVSAFTFKTRIIPFYRPIPIDFYQGAAIAVLADDNYIGDQDSVTVDRKNGVQLSSNSDDPQLIFTPQLCDKLGHNFIIETEITANQDDGLRVFIDEGEGFNKRLSYTYSYQKGRQSIWLPIGTNNCHRIRLDPFSKSDTILSNLTMRFIPYKARQQGPSK